MSSVRFRQAPPIFMSEGWLLILAHFDFGAFLFWSVV